MPVATGSIFRHRQQVPSIVHFNLARPDLLVPNPFVPCSPTHVHLLHHLHMCSSSSSRTHKSSVGSPHIRPAACVHGLTSPLFNHNFGPCAKVSKRTLTVSAAVTTAPACGVERTHYSVLQTVRTPTLSATHHIVPAHNTTLWDMPSTAQLDKEPTSATYNQGDRAHTR